MAYDEELADRLRDVLAGADGLVEKKMFGGLAFLIDGHMAVSASGTGGLLLRAQPSQTDELLDRPHAEPFVMRGKPMDGWLRIAPEGVATETALEEWVEVGVSYVRSLPPK